MPLEDPNLDDRGFEQLVSEAKRRIPNYTPEWTDLNESDLGITLVQLFAHLSELIINRLNRVPGKNYIKFLELLGISLKPAAPAQADLAFTLTTPKPEGDGFVTILQGTQVSLADAGEGGPVIFETDENLDVVGPALTHIQSFDTALFQLIGEADHGPDRKFNPFGDGLPRQGAALYLGFNERLPQSNTKSITLGIYVFSEELAGGKAGLRAPDVSGRLVSEDQIDPVEEELRALEVPPVAVVWEFLNAAGEWQALENVKDTTEYCTRSGKVRFSIPEGTTNNMKSELIGQLATADDKKPHYWIRYRIAEVFGQGYQDTPQLEDVTLNVVNSTNAVTVTDELLGASDGSTNQRFQLAHRPVLRGTLLVEVWEESKKTFVEWGRVNDFASSKRDDRHYTSDDAAGIIVFGDGVNGMIPPRLTGDDEETREKDRPNIKATRYRWGGGARGNAGAGKITSLESAAPLVDSVRNPRPSEGGEDEETLEKAKKRAPQTIRTHSRAVTGEDFEFLAKETPGARIRRARALPLHHPEIEPSRPGGDELEATTVPVPGVVTVVVVPAGEPDDPKPMPTEETLGRVGRWLNRHRLITTELYVAGPKYRKVTVEVSATVHRNESLREVEERLQTRLRKYFHPLTGGSPKTSSGVTTTGEEQEGEGWEFGGTIFFSDTFRVILETRGIAGINSERMTTRVDDQPYRACTDIELAPDEIVYSTKHFVTLRYE